VIELALRITIVVVSAIMSTLAAPVQARLLRELDRRHLKVWRPAQDPISGFSSAQQREAAHRLAKAGTLERLERGAYLVVPRSGARLTPPIEVVGSWFANEPHALIGAAAAEFHGLTNDTPSTIDIQLARVKREEIEFQLKRYRFVRSSLVSVTTDNVVVRSASVSTSVASPAKLLVLLLNQHRRGSGTVRDARLAMEVVQRGAVLDLWRTVAWDRIVRRHGTAATARRLGYLLERHDIPGAEKLLRLRGAAGYTPFSAVHPAQGPLSTRWRLRLNDPVIIGVDAHSNS
jgi:predicted transcriptional regulator of viral defense system